MTVISIMVLIFKNLGRINVFQQDVCIHKENKMRSPTMEVEPNIWTSDRKSCRSCRKSQKIEAKYFQFVGSGQA